MMTVLVTTRLQRRTERTARRTQQITAAAAVLSAVAELQLALMSYRARWTGWSATWPVLAVIVQELIGGGSPLWHQGGVAAVRTATDWRRAQADAAHLAIEAPSTRLIAAMVQVSLAGNAELTAAADKLSAAVAEALQHAGRNSSGESSIHSLDVAIRQFRKAVDLIAQS
jgi:hypothetical protein